MSGLTQEEILAFGPFRLYADRKLLLRHQQAVRLGGRAIDLLIALARQPGQLLSQRELVAQVWPHTIVEESSLRVHVAALRRALSLGDGAPHRAAADGGHHGYISNVPGRGYSFQALVRTLPAEDDDGLAGGWCIGERAPAMVTATAAAAMEAAAAAACRPPQARISSVTGRAAETGLIVARLCAQQTVTRLLTITGSGGVGKSTLAIAAATATATRSAFPGGVLHLDLGAYVEVDVEASDIPAGLAAAPGRSLLVLDNCEHLVAQAAALAERLLAAAPGLTILATSREPLLADGEYLYRLQPLAAPPADCRSAAAALAYPAMQLLMERAGSALAGFTLDDASLPLACGICRRLDGLPLALEYAAASIAALGLRGIADQLGRQQLHLAGARRNAPPRQTSLQASYDWSYRLLPAGQQALFRRLGVFADSFSLEAACAIAPDVGMTPAQLTTALVALVSKSMVVADAGPGEHAHADAGAGGHAAAGRVRYRLLATARAYAVEQLAQAAPPVLVADGYTASRMHSV